jgi:hypothetical protein
VTTAAVTPDPNQNPFDTPLNSEKQEQQQPAQQGKPFDPSVNPFDEPLASEKADSDDSGEITNDVGNKVIVPKKDEDFSDTMKRAVQYHQSLSPDQRKQAMQKEVATIPKKAAETVGAAPLIGAAVPAAMAGSAEVLTAAKNSIMKHLAAQSPEMFGHDAVKETLKKYAVEGLKKAGVGASWAAGAEVLHSIWDEVFGGKKK